MKRILKQIAKATKLLEAHDQTIRKRWARLTPQEINKLRNDYVDLRIEVDRFRDMMHNAMRFSKGDDL
jgi:hypothetical protein